MTNLLTQLETLTPVAEGGFSELYLIDGKAVKVLDDQCYTDILEECWKQNLAAEAGLAPKVHTVAKLTEDKIIIVMDMIDTDCFYHADGMDDTAPTNLGELNKDDMATGLALYCKLLKAGIVHADFHSGNWFLSDNGDTLAIDFGIASELNQASAKHLKRAVQYMLPALEQLGYGFLAQNLLSAYQTSESALRSELIEIANEIA